MPLLDLQTTPLRDYWLEEDFQCLLAKKEALFALMAVSNTPRSGPVDAVELGEGDFGLVNQRRCTPLDTHQGFEHPRDLPITGLAYRSLLAYARNHVNAGRYQLPPDWRQRWPDIARYHDGHVFRNDEFPLFEDNCQ